MIRKEKHDQDELALQYSDCCESVCACVWCMCVCMCAAHCSKLRKLLSNAWQWYTTDTTSRQLSLRQKSPSLTPRTNQMTAAFVLCFADSARSGSFRFIVINFIYSSIWAESALLRYTCMCINLSTLQFAYIIYFYPSICLCLYLCYYVFI